MKPIIKINSKTPETWKLRFFYFFRYFGDGACYAFLPIFFMFVYPGTDTLSVIYKTILVSVNPVMSVIGNAVVSKIAGNEKRNLLILKIITPFEIAILASIGFAHLVPGVGGFLLLLSFACIANFCDMTSFSLMDAMAGDVISIEGGKFMWIRIVGSASYTLMAFLLGFIVSAINAQDAVVGYSYGFLCIAPVYLIGYVSLYTISPYDINEYRNSTGFQSNSEDKDVSSYSYKDLFSNKSFVFYLIYMATMIGLLFVIDNIYSDYYSSVLQPTADKDPIKLSYSNAIMYVSEVVAAFVFIPLVKPKHFKVLIFLSGSLLFLRMILLGTFSYFDKDVVPYALFVVANFSRGFTFASYSMANVPILQNILGVKLKTKGISIINLGFALVSFIGMFVYNALIGAFRTAGLGSGHYMTFFVFAIFYFATFFLLPFIKINKNESEMATKEKATN